MVVLVLKKDTKKKTIWAPELNPKWLITALVHRLHNIGWYQKLSVSISLEDRPNRSGNERGDRGWSVEECPPCRIVMDCRFQVLGRYS